MLLSVKGRVVIWKKSLPLVILTFCSDLLAFNSECALVCLFFFTFKLAGGVFQIIKGLDLENMLI